jgi:hypothetical protein
MLFIEGPSCRGLDPAHWDSLFSAIIRDGGIGANKEYVGQYQIAGGMDEVVEFLKEWKSPNWEIDP